MDNGLLLSAAYDAAFDALLIGFKPNGAVYLAPDFDVASATAAGIDPAAKLSMMHDAVRPYLQVHTELVASRVRLADKAAA